MTLKRRAVISAHIFARLLRYFRLPCKNLTITTVRPVPLSTFGQVILVYNRRYNRSEMAYNNEVAVTVL